VEYCRISNLAGLELSRIGITHLDSTQRSLIIRREGELSTAYVVDREGRNLFVVVTPVTTERKTLSRETLGITAGVDSTMASTSTRETIGWVELGLSVERVNRDIAQAKTAAILLTMLVLVTTILMIIFIVNAITRPITNLVQATDLISRGDFSTKVEILQRDEIGHLASTFNAMIESLKQSRDEIEQYNRTLEEKIIERTQQLEDAQAQLVQSEKLSAIGQLAAGVAHELNNRSADPGLCQSPGETPQKRPEKTQAKEIQSYIRYVTDIEVQARRCKTIVQNLLRFSRSSRTVEFEELDINKTIEETVTFVEHQLRISQMELEVVLTPNLPIILGNAGQLQQVFTNLLINAMHASEPGSVIQIKSRYSPALGEFGGTVEVSVADHGHGISEENIKKIFEPFFTTKEVGKGTGLGLSVSYGIVKEHGGEISVESETEVGTTFTIVLPVQKSPVQTDIGEKTRESTTR
jgi:two-component system NtrC family sensor kinase